MSTLIDVSLVREAAANQPDKIVELLQLCRQSLESDRNFLSALLEQEGVPLAGKRKMAHRIHGAARMIGAQTLADICQLIKDADEENIDVLLTRLLREAVEVEKAIMHSIASPEKTISDTGHPLLKH